VFLWRRSKQPRYLPRIFELAAVWKLPIVYVVQNNQYAMTTAASYAVSVKDISERAKGYGIPGMTVDGNDVLAVYEAVDEAMKEQGKVKVHL